MNIKFKVTNDQPFPQEGVALIIGGSGGIGETISLLLAESGSNIAFTYKSNRKKAEEIANKINEIGQRSYFEQLDISDYHSTKKTVKNVINEFGGIHTVVYASGPPFDLQYFSQIDYNTWKYIINSDLNGFFNLIQTTLPFFRKQKNGSYVSVTTAAINHYPVKDSLSVIPKSAIEMITKVVAKEEGKYGIRANCVAPGMINAGSGAKIIEEATPQIVDSMIKEIPLNKFGTPRDIAEAVVFLASSKAAHINGHILNVDGGWVI